MKKLLLFAALVLGVVSCMKDQTFDANVGGETDVVLSVALPSDGTRTNLADSATGAIGNINLTDDYDIRYILEVYDAYENLAKRIVKTENTEQSTTFELRLIPGRAYTFVVWADFVAQGTEADNHYITSGEFGLRNVSLNNTSEHKAMDESRDAYTGTYYVENFSSSSQIAFELKRPFAKLRVVTNDMNQIYSSLVSGKVEYNVQDVYTAFNALTEAPVAASAGSIAVKSFPYDETTDYTTNRENEKTLFADYLFGTASTTVQFALTVTDSVEELPTVYFNTAIPVQRNYLTTIYGPILTDYNNVTVTINPAFENEDNFEEAPYYQVAVTNGVELIKALMQGREIIVLNNITVTAADLAAATRAGEVAINPVLNLNGCTVTFVNDTDEPLITVAEGSSLTIVDEKGTGAIVLEGTGAAIENNGTLNIEGGSVESNNGTVIVNNGEANIEGGELKAGAIQNDGTTNVTDGTINEGAITNTTNGKTEITGGEFTYTPDADEVDDDYEVKTDENGKITIERKDDVAKIGEVGYTSLAKAVAAIQDGETITLIADEVFTENNYYDNGGWKDGLGYAGDKSFTIDLNGYTISQNGALNDYLIWIKNDGSKANTITLKNGTLDAGTTAYCALATSSSNKQKITINLEGINLVGNNSNGAVAKIRGGAELNVKSGTVITGKNNYVGIEAVGNNTVVNIYDNVNIYQNGTSSYVGAIVGASYNATMNIYGGYGKSAKCGIIVMSTGATINVSGGEWIANNDGTVDTDNNAVLVSQNNRYETGWACKSILNVTGGTFKGGYNCYGMGPGVEPDDAQINIKGGNFNADPANYVVACYEAKEENGTYTVENVGHYTDAEGNHYITNAKGLAWVSENVNTMEFYGSGSANIFDNKTVYLANDIDLGGAEWRPIGDYAFSRTSFNGVFDGQGYTVSNFKVTEPVRWTEKVTEASYGFFGNVKGTIKNLTIKNAIVNPDGGRYSAALVGRLHNGGCIENCHVENSSVTILHWQVGGLVGQNNNGNISDCSVVGSTITGKAAVGAIVGMDMAVGEHTIENCRVANTALVQNESFGASYDASYGLAVGLVNVSDIVLNIDNVVAENNTIKGVADNTLVGDIETGATVTIDGVSIATTAEQLAAAIKAGKNVILGADIEIDSTINVVNNQTVTIDLNGHNITSEIAGKPSENFELFHVSGKLNIVGNGIISLTSEDFEWNSSYRYTPINIRETGVVTLGEGVSVICEASKDGSYGMSYAVDIYSTGTLNINGASLHSNYIAVRCFFGNSVVNVNSGSQITSSKNNYGIWLQNSPGAVVTIADDVNYTFENNIYYFN